MDDIFELSEGAKSTTLQLFMRLRVRLFRTFGGSACLRLASQGVDVLRSGMRPNEARVGKLPGEGGDLRVVFLPLRDLSCS